MFWRILLPPTSTLLFVYKVQIGFYIFEGTIWNGCKNQDSVAAEIVYSQTDAAPGYVQHNLWQYVNKRH